MAKLGKPIDGMEVRIIYHWSNVKNREKGRVLIRGSSVIPRYLAEKPFGNEWVNTGDLGNFADEQLVICGREKDLIVLAGGNITQKRSNDP